MKQQQLGIALVTVLIFLVIFSLLSLSALEMCQLEIKMNQTRWHREQLFIKSEEALKKIEQDVRTKLPLCSIPIMSRDALLNQPLSWWESFSSCVGNFQWVKYYYVIEVLGEDPCAYAGDPSKSVDYYRISLLGMNVNSAAIIHLQSTFTLSHLGNPTECHDVRHLVSEGRQTWNDLLF